ncbi:hypothetical protein IC582_019959 [Cucumis melo]
MGHDHQKLHKTSNLSPLRNPRIHVTERWHHLHHVEPLLHHHHWNPYHLYHRSCSLHTGYLLYNKLPFLRRPSN